MSYKTIIKVSIISIAVILIANVAFAFSARSFRIPSLEIPTFEIPEIPIPEIPPIDNPLTTIQEQAEIYYNSVCTNPALTGMLAFICDTRNRVDNIENTEGPQGEQGEVGPAGPAGKSLQIVDANGKEVGYLIDFLEHSNGVIWGVIVFDPNINGIIGYQIDTGNFTRYSITTVSSYFYESSDCSGPLLADNIHTPYQVTRLNKIDKIYSPKDFSALRGSGTVNTNSRIDSNNPSVCIGSSNSIEYAAEIEEFDIPTYVGPLSMVE